MSNIAIRVEHLSKQYKIGRTRQRHDTLRDQLVDGVRSLFRRDARYHLSTDSFWALDDVSFEVRQGEILGIVGRNGAGKSTLLKILSRITEPTSGRVEIYGRMSSLLEVGTGFHPELTGRENIYLNAAILGMRKAEIDRKFDDIVAFAEIEKFIDMSVKHYSSGMYVRLAFAVAAHLEPEILLVDEVLAVGDASFQKKCLGKMGAVAKEGRTVLFVSHNMGAILQLCSRAIVLVAGKRVLDSDASTAISTYLGEIESSDNAVTFDVEPDKDMQITSMSVVSPDGNAISSYPHTGHFCVLINYRVEKWKIGSYVCLDVFNSSDVCLLWSCDVTSVDNMLIERMPGIYQSRIIISGMILSPGRYYFTGAIYTPGRMSACDVKDRAVSIEVVDGGSLLSNFGIRPPAVTMIPLAWETKLLASGS